MRTRLRLSTTSILESEWRERRGSRPERFSTRVARTTCLPLRVSDGPNEAHDRQAPANREKRPRPLRARSLLPSQARVSGCTDRAGLRNAPRTGGFHRPEGAKLQEAGEDGVAVALSDAPDRCGAPPCPAGPN